MINNNQTHISLSVLATVSTLTPMIYVGTAPCREYRIYVCEITRKPNERRVWVTGSAFATMTDSSSFRL